MTGPLDTLMDSTVYDSHDDKIGKVKNIYVNNETGSPTWASVSMGLFRHDSLVPLVGAQHDPQSDALRVNVDKEMVKSAPAVEQNGHISREGEEQLLRHYHVDPNRTVTVPTSREEGRVEREPVIDARAYGQTSLGDEEQEVTDPGRYDDRRYPDER